MKHYWQCILIVFVGTLTACMKTGKEGEIKDNEIDVIAFGSCSRHDAEEQMWGEVMELNPDIWIWAGDNIYGDYGRHGPDAGQI